jgi:hypothetical protein
MEPTLFYLSARCLYGIIPGPGPLGDLVGRPPRLRRPEHWPRQKAGCQVTGRRLEQQGDPWIVTGLGQSVKGSDLRRTKLTDGTHRPRPNPLDLLELDPPAPDHISIGDAKIEALGSMIGEVALLVQGL